MNIVNDLVTQARAGQSMMMGEEYKDRGYNGTRWSQGSQMRSKAIEILHCLGYDEHGELLTVVPCVKKLLKIKPT